MATGPLNGIRVVDLSRILAGPWASQLLADYGADVIKVERPGSGDETRQWGPPWLTGPGDGGNGEAACDSAYFLAANRNKRSITVNLADPRGQLIVRQLAERSDVLLENFKVGDLLRYGLDADSLRRRNPRLIYCSISAYGQTGSRSAMAGYDAMVQATGGLMSITGATDDEGGSPQKVGVAIADIMAGMYAATAVLAALNERHASGKGECIDVPLYDSQVAWLANQNMNYLVSGEVPGRRGTAHPNIVPYQVFPAADGDFMLAVGSDLQFARCVSCIGLPELASSPKFSRNAARVKNREALVTAMSNAFRCRPLSYWLPLLEKNKIPAGPINSIDTVLGDEYAKERRFVRQLPHRKFGDVPSVANPVTFTRQAIDYTRAPPMLGEHTEEILSGELGYSAASVSELRACGAI